MVSLTAFEDRFSSLSGMMQAATSKISVEVVYWLGKLLRRKRGWPEFGTVFDAEEIRSVLLIRADGLGDMVLFSSLVREIRHLWPSAKITLVVDQRFLSFVEQCPHVDEVIGFDQRGSKYVRLIKGPLRALELARKHFWASPIDLAVSPRWDVDSRHAAVLGYLSFARYHFGFSEQVSRRKQRINAGLHRLFSHNVPSKPGVRHEFDRNGEVLTALGGAVSRLHNPELWLSDADRSYARQVLARNSVNSHQLLVCLGIGATEAKRRWPIERFAALGEWLIETYNAKILVVGDSVDACKAEQMRSILGSAMMNQAGVCTVRQSAALLSFCNIFVGNDSGPMHLAAASDIPIVEISCHPKTASSAHINSPVRYAPLSSWMRILQPAPLAASCASGCNDASAHCILNVYVDDVKDLLVDLVNEQLLTRQQAASAGD